MSPRGDRANVITSSGPRPDSGPQVGQDLLDVGVVRDLDERGRALQRGGLPALGESRRHERALTGGHGEPERCNHHGLAHHPHDRARRRAVLERDLQRHVVADGETSCRQRGGTESDLVGAHRGAPSAHHGPDAAVRVDEHHAERAPGQLGLAEPPCPRAVHDLGRRGQRFFEAGGRPFVPHANEAVPPAARQLGLALDARQRAADHGHGDEQRHGDRQTGEPDTSPPTHAAAFRGQREAHTGGGWLRDARIVAERPTVTVRPANHAPGAEEAGDGSGDGEADQEHGGVDRKPEIGLGEAGHAEGGEPRRSDRHGDASHGTGPADEAAGDRPAGGASGARHTECAEGAEVAGHRVGFPAQELVEDRGPDHRREEPGDHERDGVGAKDAVDAPGDLGLVVEVEVAEAEFLAAGPQLRQALGTVPQPDARGAVVGRDELGVGLEEPGHRRQEAQRAPAHGRELAGRRDHGGNPHRDHAVVGRQRHRVARPETEPVGGHGRHHHLVARGLVGQTTAEDLQPPSGGR